MWINQDAYFSLGEFDAGTEAKYSIKYPGNGAYVFVIDGEVQIAGQLLKRRDAIGVFDTKNFVFKVDSKEKLLVIDVPMQ